jgi:hypothetical protein
MQTLQFDVNLAEQWRDRYQADINRALEEMRAYNLDGVHNPPRWAVIQRQAEFATEQREIFETQRNEASKKLLADRLKLTRAYFDRIVPVMRLGAKALLALRAELEFDRPSTVLLDELEATIESMKNETEDIHSALSQKFREMKIID